MAGSLYGKSDEIAKASAATELYDCFLVMDRDGNGCAPAGLSFPQPHPGFCRLVALAPPEAMSGSTSTPSQTLSATS